MKWDEEDSRTAKHALIVGVFSTIGIAIAQLMIGLLAGERSKGTE